MPDADTSDRQHGGGSYYSCLRDNPHFRLLWLAETVDCVGSWLNYIATLSLVEEFSGGKSLAVSAVVIIRFLPSLVLAPICGVVADRCNRVRILQVMALLDAAVVASLALVQHPSQTWLLYLLLALQFTFTSFYDPARKAMVPVVVSPSQLHLATTIDSWAWSITGAVGASVGGLLASRLGNSACFLIDSLTYLAAAWCAYLLPLSLGRPGAAPPLEPVEGPVSASGEGRSLLKKHQSDRGFSLELSHMEGDREVDEGRVESGRLLQGEQASGAAHPTKAERRHHGAPGANQAQPGQQPQQQHGAAPGQQAKHAQQGQRRTPRGKHKQSDPEESPLVPPGPAPSSSPAGALLGYEGPEGAQAPGQLGIGSASGGGDGGEGGGGILAAAVGAVQEAGRAAWEGWLYMTAKENRWVAAMVTIKSCGSLVWGAVDVLQVRFSQMERMQKFGDAPITLGLIFAAVGLGCFVGPIILNYLVPPRPRPLAWGVAASFGLLLCGFLLMLSAPGISFLLASTFVRAMGSATLWIYSSLLLQQLVPNAILGRTSAVEMAFYTITEAVSSVFGGAAFDVLHLTLQQTVLALTALSACVTALWAAFAAAYSKHGGGGGDSGGSGNKGYAVVATEDEVGLEP